MWSILCRFRDFSPLLVALYCGQSKPNNVEEYLSDVILELQQLQQEGIVHSGTTHQVSVRAFICDAPARAFLKCIKNHSGYNACEWGTTRGTYEGRVVLGSKEPGAIEGLKRSSVSLHKRILKLNNPHWLWQESHVSISLHWTICI